MIHLSILLALCSLFLFHRQNTRLAVGVLFLAALVLRYHYITLDLFLHDWDERFHALVAKNMMAAPFKPMLRVSPVMDYDYAAWCCNHVWLHKQPLFLWQMALSMKIFGVSEVTLRIPNMLMGSLLVPLIYKIGKNWANERIGFFAAFIGVFAQYQLQLISGNMPVEHNDIAFLFYSTASIWAYSEYVLGEKRKWQWIILVGIFAGCAVLCKWLTGLFVFSGWGLVLLTQKEQRRLLANWFHIGTAFLVSVLIFMPWQIYTHLKFPKESLYERTYNSRHFSEALEGHGGTWTFYLEMNSSYYGTLGYIIAALGLLMLLFLRQKISKQWLAWLVYAILPYAFFSLAATKMPSYVYFISPIIHLSIACFAATIIDYAANRLGKMQTLLHSAALSAAMLFMAWQVFHTHPIWALRGDSKVITESNRKLKNTNTFKALNHKIGKDMTVIFLRGNTTCRYNS